MNGFLYTLTLHEPVLANSLNGEPNSANSLYYIPGGLIRGAAVNAYGGTKDASDDTFRRLFLNGSARFLNAYPLAEGKKISTPTPILYKKPKYFEGSDFSFVANDKVHALEEEWQINVHTQRDAKLGHATTDAGAVYRYIALPAGMVLQGAILTENAEDAKTLESLLKDKNLLLGKARTAGYGHATLDTQPLGDWHTFPGVSGDTFTLTLLSPVIVRDEYGQPTLNISHALQARLGVAVKILEAYQKSDVVGGFNRTWGLPLPQVTAIAAGSHFVVNTSASTTALQALHESGLGERRAEGFGWVSINAPLPKTVDDDHWETVKHFQPTQSGQPQLGNSSTAALMVKRLGKRSLDQVILHTAREMTKVYPAGKITNSQLSRWRVITRNVLDQQEEKGKRDLKRLQTFMEDSKGKAGWQKMERARVQVHGETPRLTEWIEDLLTKPETLAKSLVEEWQQTKLGSNTFTLTDEINVEYRLRLLDAVLAIMSKINGGSNG